MVMKMNHEIRHSERSDIAGLRALHAQRSCYSNTLQLPFPSFDLWEKRSQEIPEGLISLVAIVNDRVIGQIGFEVDANPRRKHVANFGMVVAEDCRGDGIGSSLVEAMLDVCGNWLAVRRIELQVYTDNQNAIRLYEKHGFSVEGTAREYAFREGRFADVHFMAKLLKQ